MFENSIKPLMNILKIKEYYLLTIQIMGIYAMNHVQQIKVYKFFTLKINIIFKKLKYQIIKMYVNVLLIKVYY